MTANSMYATHFSGSMPKPYTEPSLSGTPPRLAWRMLLQQPPQSVAPALELFPLTFPPITNHSWDFRAAAQPLQLLRQARNSCGKLLRWQQLLKLSRWTCPPSPNNCNSNSSCKRSPRRSWRRKRRPGIVKNGRSGKRRRKRRKKRTRRIGRGIHVRNHTNSKKLVS